MTESHHNDDKLASLLLRWEEAWDHGDDIPASELCADCPDLVSTLQQQIGVLKKMAWMKKDASEESDEVDQTNDLLIGKTLSGRYRIDELISEGGFGRVYRGYDSELQRQVAIKVAKPERITSTEQADDLLEEARRVAKLRHPGIVSVHDVGRDDGQVFIVSDLIDGQSLAELIATNRPTPTEAAHLIAEVADALQFAHDQGFVHFDIKPPNILIDKHGRPLLTDFGIAASTEQVMRGESGTSGTLPYMAPEQVAGEAQVIDARTDIHALGVVLYEVLTGRLPYQSITPTALREQIALRQPKPPRSINAAVPKQIEAVCLRALAKHPADRFANADEMAAALRSSLTVKSKVGQWLLIGGALIVLVAALLVFGPKWWGDHATDNGRSATNPTQAKGVFVFEGSSRIVTPLERFAPVTLEAWVRPDRYEYRCHYVIGSDVPPEYGIGMGICGVLLTAEYIPAMPNVKGSIKSKQTVPIKQWSHIAVVFGETDTRLYFNGKLVETGPPTRVVGGTNFVIGNVGENNPIDYFLGQIRCLRISKGERYNTKFKPEENFIKDAGDAPARAVLIYDGQNADGDRVIDLSGNGNDGRWERLEP